MNTDMNSVASDLETFLQDVQQIRDYIVALGAIMRGVYGQLTPGVCPGSEVAAAFRMIQDIAARTEQTATSLSALITRLRTPDVDEPSSDLSEPELSTSPQLH